MPDEAWEEARRRAVVIGRLAARPSVSHHAADAAGEELGLRRRQIYVLVERWRRGLGLVTDLAVGQSDGGRGRARLSDAVEAVIGDVILTRYLRRQRPTLAVVYRDIARACRAQGLAVPARNTVASRIAVMDPVQVVGAREGPEATRRLGAAGGTPPVVVVLLEQVQIDHTLIDAPAATTCRAPRPTTRHPHRGAASDGNERGRTARAVRIATQNRSIHNTDEALG